MKTLVEIRVDDLVVKALETIAGTTPAIRQAPALHVNDAPAAKPEAKKKAPKATASSAKAKPEVPTKDRAALKQALVDLSTAKGMDATVDVLTQFGAKKASDIQDADVLKATETARGLLA